MTPVTQYRADDGSVWATEAQALKRDATFAAIASAMAPLGPKWKDEGCSFANGGGFIQHSEVSYEKARRACIDIFHETCGYFKEDADPYARHLSHFGRVADDGGGPIADAFGRLYRIDSEFREWGQPYFALNPGKGQQTCLDDRRTP